MSDFDEATLELRALFATLAEIKGDDARFIEQEIIEPLETAFSKVYVDEESGVTAFSNKASAFLENLTMPSL